MNQIDQQSTAPLSFNGRTPRFERGNVGSNPASGAKPYPIAAHWRLSRTRLLWNKHLRWLGQGSAALILVFFFWIFGSFQASAHHAVCAEKGSFSTDAVVIPILDRSDDAHFARTLSIAKPHCIVVRYFCFDLNCVSLTAAKPYRLDCDRTRSQAWWQPIAKNLFSTEVMPHLIDRGVGLADINDGDESSLVPVQFVERSLDESYSYSRSVRGDEFLARQFNLFASARQHSLSGPPQRASEGGNNNGGESGNPLAVLVKEMPGASNERIYSRSESGWFFFISIGFLVLAYLSFALIVGWRKLFSANKKSAQHQDGQNQQ